MGMVAIGYRKKTTKYAFRLPPETRSQLAGPYFLQSPKPKLSKYLVSRPNDCHDEIRAEILRRIMSPNVAKHFSRPLPCKFSFEIGYLILPHITSLYFGQNNT